MKYANLLLLTAAALPALASAANPPARTVTRDSWTDIIDVSPRYEGLLEGSYLGRGEKTRQEYRLHLLRYLEREDTFIALLEAETLELAVLGYVTRSPADGSYVWKQIATSEDSEQLLPFPALNAMYQLTPQLDTRERWKAIELAGNAQDSGVEVVHFFKVRAPQMRAAPTPGEFSKFNCDDGKTWELHVLQQQDRKNAVWSIKQVWGEQNSSRTETDLARYDLPGILSLRETINTGFEPKPSPRVKWAVVEIDHTEKDLFSESHREELMVFEHVSLPASERSAAVEYLNRPGLGYRLRFRDPR